MKLVFGKSSNGKQPAMVIAGALVMYSGAVVEEPVNIIDPWTKAISDRNWSWNKLPQSNWELVVSERNWRAVE